MTTRAAGRPRDPRVDDDVRDAARRLYSAKGWLGFTFEAVAREAKVGKPAVYLRWSSREHLLVDALRDLPFPRPREQGSFRDELHDVAHRLADWWLDGSGRITLRLLMEGATFPELVDVYEEVVRQPGSAAGLALARQAIARGELPADTQPYLVAEMLTGALLTHYIFTRRTTHGDRAALHAYADEVVEALLRAFPPAPR